MGRFRRIAAQLCLAIMPLIAVLPAPAFAQTAFGQPALPGSREVSPRPSGPAAALPVFDRFRVWVQATQRELHGRLADAVRRMKDGGGFEAVWLLASLSFFYGVVHAAGPGHGKAVISSYVLANEKTVRRGIALCFLASLMQAITAIAVVTILAVLLNAAGLRIRDAARGLETGSYILVVAVGAWLVWSALRRMRGAAPHAHDHDHHGHGHHHGHDEHCGHAHLPGADQVAMARDWKSSAAIILAVGLRPCAGALLVLVFAFANGLFLAGVGATFAMALGTALTVSALAVLAITSRELAMRLAGPGSRRAELVFNLAALGGGLMVLCLGMMLVAGAMEPARPF